MLRRLLLLTPAAALLLAAGNVTADSGCDKPTDMCCEPAMVEKTIMVPVWTTEKRKVMCTEYRREKRTRTYNVVKRIPETKWVERCYTVMIPEKRTKVVKYTVCKPVCKWVDQEYTVMVPHTEKRVGTRTVCKTVTEQRTRTVCVDKGHWETKVECVCCIDKCGCPRKKKVCKKVWVPNIVKKECPYTVCRRVPVQQEYEYCVTVCKPKKCVRKVKKVDYIKQPCEKEVCYTVCRPEKRTKKCCVTTYKCVTEPRTCCYTVCVPYQVEKEVCVRVCKMEPRTIKVPCPQPCCDPCCEPCCPKDGLFRGWLKRHCSVGYTDPCHNIGC